MNIVKKLILGAALIGGLTTVGNAVPSSAALDPLPVTFLNYKWTNGLKGIRDITPLTSGSSTISVRMINTATGAEVIAPQTFTYYSDAEWKALATRSTAHRFQVNSYGMMYFRFNMNGITDISEVNANYKLEITDGASGKITGYMSVLDIIRNYYQAGKGFETIADAETEALQQAAGVVTGATPDAGDIQYGNSGGYAKLGIGTEGQVLTVDKAATASDPNYPAWKDLSGTITDYVPAMTIGNKTATGAGSLTISKPKDAADPTQGTVDIVKVNSDGTLTMWDGDDVNNARISMVAGGTTSTNSETKITLQDANHNDAVLISSGKSADKTANVVIGSINTDVKTKSTKGVLTLQGTDNTHNLYQPYKLMPQNNLYYDYPDYLDVVNVYLPKVVNGDTYLVSATSPARNVYGDPGYLSPDQNKILNTDARGLSSWTTNLTLGHGTTNYKTSATGSMTLAGESGSITLNDNADTPINRIKLNAGTTTTASAISMLNPGGTEAVSLNAGITDGTASLTLGSTSSSNTASGQITLRNANSTNNRQATIKLQDPVAGNYSNNIYLPAVASGDDEYLVAANTAPAVTTGTTVSADAGKMLVTNNNGTPVWTNSPTLGTGTTLNGQISFNQVNSGSNYTNTLTSNTLTANQTTYLPSNGNGNYLVAASTAPAVTTGSTISADAGKILRVNMNGTPEWQAEGKILSASIGVFLSSTYVNEGYRVFKYTPTSANATCGVPNTDLSQIPEGTIIYFYNNSSSITLGITGILNYSNYYNIGVNSIAKFILMDGAAGRGFYLF